jgi:hypothetical protein
LSVDILDDYLGPLNFVDHVLSLERGFIILERIVQSFLNTCLDGFRLGSNLNHTHPSKIQVSD